MSAEVHAALGEHWHAAWSGRDGRAFRAICAPDVHYEDPVTRAPLTGTAALAAHAERLWRAFPDVRMEPTGEPLTGGAFIALPVRIHGRNTGQLDILPASHRELAVHAIFWCELDARGEVLWRVRAFFDAHAAAVELGLLPRPGSWRRRAVHALQGYGVFG